MNILKVKDSSGNWVDIPALKGDSSGPTDTQVQNAVDEYLDDHPAVSGTFTNSAKRFLLELLRKVAYVDEYGQTYLENLAHALNPSEEYLCTNTLTGCTTSNPAPTVYKGESYSATITPDTGYTLTGATASVTMGGSSVPGAYNSGEISISSVTGAIVITVTAVSNVSSISAVFTQGSNVIYDTASLDTLRQYLVVTATYADTTTGEVSDYTLSGSLTAGTSTVTVAYGGKTDTFSVTVTEAPTYGWKNDVFVITSDHMFQGSIGTSYGSGTPHYYSASTTRVSYNECAVDLSSAYTYSVSVETTLSGTINFGYRQLKASGYTKVQNHKTLTSSTDITDSGWQTLPYTFTALDGSYLWFALRKSGDATVTPSNFPTVTVTRTLVST